MANYKTGAQRYNDRMGKSFDKAKNEGRGLVGNSGSKGVGINSPAMMEARKSFARTKALKNKKETKKEYTKRHHDDLMKYETN